MVRFVSPGRPAIKPEHLKVRAVCNGCNNGWMSRLEEAVRAPVLRLLSDQRVRLTHDEANSLVRWCQKTTAVLDVWNPQEKSVRRDVYDHLSRGDNVPGNWDIRLARIEPGHEFSFNHSVYGSGAQDVANRNLAGISNEPIGVQSMFAIGHAIFMVRYSPHDFRGKAALDADYHAPEVWYPPAVLLGENSKRIFKPATFPVYDRAAWDTWTLWSVAREPGIMPAVAKDESGRTWVDDINNVINPKEIAILERHSQRFDAPAVMARTPRNEA